jgi:RNA polymerase sigma-70 factor (ECF subfamily)
LEVERTDTTAADLSELYRAHAGFVWRSLRHFGVADPDVDDLLHEVFIVVQRRLPTFDPQYSVRGWLYGIARGTASNYRRGRRRAKYRNQTLRTIRCDADSMANARQAEALQVIGAFVDGLEPKMREVFVLAIVEGFSGPELAQTLGIKLPTAYSRIRLVRERFLAMLAQNPPGGGT